MRPNPKQVQDSILFTSNLLQNKMDQEEMLKDLIKNGVDLSEDKGSTSYEVCEIEIFEVETTVTGPDAKYEYLKGWEAGQAMLILQLKVTDGVHKDVMTMQTISLYSRKGSLKTYRGFEGRDGLVPSSVLGEIIHLIKEYDSTQWDETKFKPGKLLKKKFTIGVKEITKKSDGSPAYLLEFEEQIAKDERWKEDNPLEDESKSEFTSSKDSEEKKVKESDLPF